MLWSVPAVDAAVIEAVQRHPDGVTIQKLARSIDADPMVTYESASRMAAAGRLLLGPGTKSPSLLDAIVRSPHAS